MSSMSKIFCLNKKKNRKKTTKTTGDIEMPVSLGEAKNENKEAKLIQEEKQQLEALRT